MSDQINANLESIVINILHLLFIFFILFAPFSDIPAILTLHIVSCICLIIHWCSNSDQCYLTQLEQKYRGISDSKTFTYKLVSPIYNINEIYFNKIVWIVTFIVLCVSLYKLYNSKQIAKMIICYNTLSDSGFFKKVLTCVKQFYYSS